jgi:hypothetical protein
LPSQVFVAGPVCTQDLPDWILPAHALECPRKQCQAAMSLYKRGSKCDIS